MKLASSRDIEKQRDVLKEPNAEGPNPIYWVFNEVSSDKWENVTIIQPGRYVNEYPKTYGHYHKDDAPDEIYHLIEGEGILQLQKKDLSEVYLIKARAGDQIVIKNDMGHSWSNVGSTPLISYDDWRNGHTPDEYTPMEKLHGMAYYLVEENGEVRAHANPNYTNLPEPKWLTAEEFKNL